MSAKRSRRSRIPVYSRAEEHEKLEQALYDWRDKTAREILGEDVVVQHGTQLLMDDGVIASIVNCLTTMRITSLADLQVETSWPLEWIETCGPSLLGLILEHYPVPDDEPISVDTPTIPQVISSIPSHLPLKRKRAVVKCSQCGNSGHNSKFFLFFCLIL